MKVCFINCLKIWGGGEKWHLEHALYMHRKGHDVTVVSLPESPLLTKAQESGLKTKSFKISNLSFLNPAKLFAVWSFLKKERFDAVLMNSSRDLKTFAPLCRLAGTRKIIFRKGSDIPIKDTAMNRFLYRKCVTHILANSNATKQSFLKYNRSLVPEEKMTVIYNGIDTSKKSAFSSTKNDVPVICNLGRMVHQKRQDLLLDVAAILKRRNVKCRFVIGGDGPLKEELAAKAEVLNLLDIVTFCGFIDKPHDFMAKADIFALTSEWEGFGYVLTEAMLEKKAVVAFDISSNPEIISNGHNGFLVKWNDTEAFANALQKLIDDENMRKTFGENGLCTVLDKFDFNTNREKVEAFICN